MKVISLLFIFAAAANAFTIAPLPARPVVANQLTNTAEPSLTAKVVRSSTIKMLPPTRVPDGKGGYKSVDPKELTPQFILFFTVMFVCDYCRYHPL
eukprot:CAMPEP_0115827374 /NCGR_PEP_ID=MMETSP0287-20121206/9_1 /TAXON_ID=412157 /ORGANISM="Chrysochromulina rotalis, Strain UIO044" /LENGTH=95 /DNA_ID=CAMNT_0003280525 /DNA_START=40 /DNA_END=327 /DNA_ORIENTATION=-